MPISIQDLQNMLNQMSVNIPEYTQPPASTGTQPNTPAPDVNQTLQDILAGGSKPNKWEDTISNQASNAVSQGVNVGQSGVANDFGLSGLVGNLGANAIGNEGTRQNFLLDAISGTPAIQSEMTRAYNTATGGPENFGVGRTARARIGTDAIKQIGNQEQQTRIGAANVLGTSNALDAFTKGAAPFLGQATATNEVTAGNTTGQSTESGFGRIPKGTVVQQGGGGGGGGTVICTELQRQNKLSKKILVGASKYGMACSRDTYRGYILWAVPVVNLMQKGGRFNDFMTVLGTAWATELAYRTGYHRTGNLFGKCLLFIGLPICNILGRFCGEPKLNWRII